MWTTILVILGIVVLVLAAVGAYFLWIIAGAFKYLAEKGWR